MLLCDMPLSIIISFKVIKGLGDDPICFFVVVGTHTEHVINEFALDARINI